MKLSNIMMTIPFLSAFVSGVTSNKYANPELCQVLYNDSCDLPGPCIDTNVLQITDSLAKAVEGNPDLATQYVVLACKDRIDARSEDIVKTFETELNQSLKDGVNLVPQDELADELNTFIMAEARTLMTVATFNVFTLFMELRDEMSDADLLTLVRAVDRLKLAKFTKDRYQSDIKFAGNLQQCWADANAKEDIHAVMGEEIPALLEDYSADIAQNLAAFQYDPEANNTLLFTRAHTIQGMDASYLKSEDDYDEIVATTDATAKPKNSTQNRY